MKKKQTTAGSSGSTVDKQIKFSGFLDYHLNICQRIFKRNAWITYPYVYIDMNAGPGYYENVDVPGSPAIFIECAERIGINWFAYFIDSNTDYIDNLKIIADDSKNKIDFINGDHTEYLPIITNQLKNKNYGLLYHDPNGEISFDVLRRVFLHQNMKYMDVLIHLAATTVKRVRKAWSDKPDKNKTLHDYIHGINKTTWMIGKVEDGDRWQWTFLFGTNYEDMNAYKKMGFHRLDSTEGHEILTKLNSTAKEFQTILKARDDEEREFFFGNGAISTFGCTFSEEWDRVMAREARSERIAEETEENLKKIGDDKNGTEN